MSILWDGLSIFIEPLESLVRGDLGAVITIDRQASPANASISGKEIELCLAIRGRCPVWGKYADKHLVRFRVPSKRARWARDIIRRELGVSV